MQIDGTCRHSPIPPIPPKKFFIINGRGCSNKVAPSSSRTSEPKQDDNERERWREIGSITILSRMVSNEGVRCFLYSLERPRNPSWIFDKCQRSKGEDNSIVKRTNEINGF